MSNNKSGLLGKGTSEPNPDEEVLTAAKSDDFFDSKLFRLLTVAIYMAGVGGLGFTLAVYYIFLWDSTMPPVPIYKKH